MLKEKKTSSNNRICSIDIFSCRNQIQDAKFSTKFFVVLCTVKLWTYQKITTFKLLKMSSKYVPKKKNEKLTSNKSKKSHSLVIVFKQVC